MLHHHAISMSEPMGWTEPDAMGVEMNDANFTLGGLGIFLAFWTVMMGAMMLPSAAPMILTFAAAQARRDRNVAVPTWMFVAGYILVWGYAGVVVFVLVYAGKDLVDRFAWPERLTSAQSQLMALQQVLGNSRVTARGWNCDHASRVS